MTGSRGGAENSWTPARDSKRGWKEVLFHRDKTEWKQHLYTSPRGIANSTIRSYRLNSGYFIYNALKAGTRIKTHKQIEKVKILYNKSHRQQWQSVNVTHVVKPAPKLLFSLQPQTTAETTQWFSLCRKQIQPWFSIRIIYMPVIVPVSDDSISHALYYESLKNSLVSMRSFASIWMEGKWFSAKTHRWDNEGWRKITQGQLQEERCSTNIIDPLFFQDALALLKIVQQTSH